MTETKMFSWNDVVISDLPTPALFREIKDSTNVFPFYLFSETSTQPNKEQPTTPTPVLNTKIVKQIAQKLGMAFVPEKEREGKVCYISNREVRDDYKTTFAAIDLLDYIYAVLHSPNYREKYEEFLKIDFPGIPFPKNTKTFWQLVELGKQIRQFY